jgi:hypothetical protein
MKRLFLGMATVAVFLGVTQQARADYSFTKFDGPARSLPRPLESMSTARSEEVTTPLTSYATAISEAPMAAATLRLTFPAPP